MASIDRRPNGSYRARWREHPGGPQRTKSFRRRVDAERWLVKVQHDLFSGSYIDPARGRLTLADWWAVWSERQPWRPLTRAQVRSSWQAHIEPAFGSRQLASLRRGEVEDWGRGLPVQPSTATRIMRDLTTMLEGAVLDGYLTANPAKGARRPKVEHAPVVPLTAAQVLALEHACPPWFAVVVPLAAAAGLRQAEATGLTVDRLDLLRKRLRVDRQLLTLTGGTSFGPPKGQRSYRTVPLADVVVHAVARHLELHGHGDGGLVAHEKGRPLSRSHFGDVWRGVVATAGLPTGTRYHDLRHHFASTLLHGGVSVPAAAEILGHSAQVLLSTYGHLVPEAHDLARAVVQASFDAAEDTVRTGRA